MGLTELRGMAIAVLLLAMALVAVGRRFIRKSRRPAAYFPRRGWLAGWLLVGVGTLLMIGGVLMW